jgi:alkylation response protein AidB-like acyl-CoA dehydrogenase
VNLSAERAENVAMLRDSAAAIVPTGGDLRRIRALRFHPPGFDPAVWRTMADMGWLGLRVPEAEGGSGLGMAELCALAEKLGGGLTPEPFVQGVMAATLLPRPAVLDGSQIVLPAWQEAPDTLTPGRETLLAGGTITGQKLFVPMAAGADAFLVCTASGMALVDAHAPGVTIESAATQDGGSFGTISFDNAAAEPVPGDPADVIEEATLATAATLLGVMESCFALTLDYLRTRKQFGKPIGSFQALQHRAADLKLQIALSRASIEAAAGTLDSGASIQARRVAVSRAKARSTDAAMLVTRQSIQLHGGIGYTDEYDAGLYLRRVMVLANSFGSSRLHRARFAALSPENDDE